MYVCMYIYVCVCVYVHVCMYVCVYIYIYTHTHVYMTRFSHFNDLGVESDALAARLAHELLAEPEVAEHHHRGKEACDRFSLVQCSIV